MLFKKFYWSILLLATTLLTLLFLNNCFQLVVIRGRSMEPTLQDGDVLLLNKLSKVEQGDVIAFQHDKYGEILVKRLLAESEQTLSISDDKVYVDGVLLQEPYIQGITASTDTELEVPFNCCFVMGDNRSLSQDSRHKSVGFIPNDQVLGKIAVRIWPLHMFTSF